MGTPVAGKFGRVIVSGNSIDMVEWSLDIQGSDVDTTTFNAPVNADGVAWKTGFVGLVEAQGTLRGNYDLALPYNNLDLYAGREITVFFGVTPVVGFTLPCRVISCRFGQNVNDKATFEATIKVNGKLEL
jgi:hypothetical protein